MAAPPRAKLRIISGVTCGGGGLAPPAPPPPSPPDTQTCAGAFSGPGEFWIVARRTAQVSSSPRDPSGFVFSSIARCAAAAIMRANLLGDELRRLLDHDFRLVLIEDDLARHLRLMRHKLIDIRELAGVL